MTTLEQFAPQVWIAERTLSSFAVRSVVVRGDRRVLIWDTLSRPADLEPLLPLLAGREVVAVYSHADWDHVWGTAGLPAPASQIVAHATCLARFADDVPETLRKKQAAEPDEWREVRLIAPTTVFERNFELDLGGLTVQLAHLPGHTVDCIVAFIPELGLMLAGDTVETPLPVINSSDPLDPWIAALEGWATDQRVRSVIPSHGLVGGREVIEHTIGYLRQVRGGGDVVVADPLDPFYQTTHQGNLAIQRGSE
jgi:glyoxylase-like metal-dependent hydrolase (beta-lactamase superfamily II)